MVNEGGVIVALVLLIGALAFGVIGSAYLYVQASASSTSNENAAAWLLVLLSGLGNIGNAVIHALLSVLLTFGDTQSFLDRGVQDADNLVGPIVLMAINGAIGWRTLQTGSNKVAVGWNTFVAFAGSLIPMVWPQFITVGLAEWPYSIVFLWLGIYAFESMAFFATLTLFLLPSKNQKND